MVSIERFEAVIFDFDGVIVDTERVQVAAWRRLAGEMGVKCEVTLGGVAGRLDRHIVPELFPGSDVGWCVGRKQAIQEEMEGAGGIEYIQETLELAERLRGRKRMGICSSSSGERILELLGKVGERPTRFLDGRGAGGVAKREKVEEWFEVIVGQVAGEACKPEPGPYLKALKLLGVSAGGACAIEDSHTGIRAAKGAGIYVIQLLHEGMERCELADAVVGSAGEIGG